MAIILKCSQCSKQLEVDDAFAGGVCRCAHCGALSQVPWQVTELDRKGRPTTPPQMGRPVVAPPEGIETLRIAPSRRYSAQRQLGILAIIMTLASVVMVALIILVLVYHFHPENKSPSPTNKKQDAKKTGPADQGGPTQEPEPKNPLKEAKGPSFVGLPLPEGHIAFLLNMGMQDMLNYGQTAIEESVKRIGPRQYVVIPWRFGNTDVANPSPPYPPDGLAKADAQARGLDPWWAKIDSTLAPDTPAAAAEAIKRGATVLLLVTRNDPEPQVVDALLDKSKDKKVTWLAAVIDWHPGEVKSYAELVRLTGGADRVLALAKSDLDKWLREEESPGQPKP